VRRAEQQESGSILLGADFGGPAADVLSAGSLVPSFDQNLLAFTLPDAPVVYDTWAAAGVMQKVLLDKAMVCPQCGALPTFRNACRKCGSGRVTNDRLIHHFACAHVDFVCEFETGDGQLVCPKCRLKKLVVGSDFEFLIGEYRCQSCAWRDSDIQLYGHCLRCNNGFESHQAREQELHQYHVHRLDPLAVTARLE
jgi:transposase-like protein